MIAIDEERLDAVITAWTVLCIITASTAKIEITYVTKKKQMCATQPLKEEVAACNNIEESAVLVELADT